MLRRGGILLAFIALLVGWSMVHVSGQARLPEVETIGGATGPGLALRGAPLSEHVAILRAARGNGLASCGTAVDNDGSDASGVDGGSGGGTSFRAQVPTRILGGEVVKSNCQRGGERTDAEQRGGQMRLDGKRPLQAAAYLPPPVNRAVEPEIGTGIRVSSAIDVGFTFLPLQYRGGAMRIANDSGRPVSVSFHGSGSAAVRLNGQPVIEGRRYLVATDIEIAGSAEVGVHLRQASGNERDPAPEGIG